MTTERLYVTWDQAVAVSDSGLTRFQECALESFSDAFPGFKAVALGKNERYLQGMLAGADSLEVFLYEDEVQLFRHGVLYFGAERWDFPTPSSLVQEAIAAARRGAF